MYRQRVTNGDKTINFESSNKCNFHISKNGPPFVKRSLFSSEMKYFATAFNQKQNLILMVSQSNCFIFYTLEGTPITTVPITNPTYEFFTSGNAKFTDHSIIICNYSGNVLYRYSDFNTLLKYMPADTGKIRKWNCLETDVDGNIYINGVDTNTVFVYTHDLQYKNTLSFIYNEKPIKIISLHIAIDVVVILSEEFEMYQIEKFSLRTAKFIESYAINSIQPTNICTDGNNNLIICGKYSNKICIQSLDGTVSYHEFEANKVSYDVLDQIVRYVSVTDKGHIVLVHGKGQVSLACRRQ